MDPYFRRHGIWVCKHGNYQGIHATSVSRRKDGLYHMRYKDCPQCGYEHTPPYEPVLPFPANASDSAASTPVSGYTEVAKSGKWMGASFSSTAIARRQLSAAITRGIKRDEDDPKAQRTAQPKPRAQALPTRAFKARPPAYKEGVAATTRSVHSAAATGRSQLASTLAKRDVRAEPQPVPLFTEMPGHRDPLEPNSWLTPVAMPKQADVFLEKPGCPLCTKSAGQLECMSQLRQHFRKYHMPGGQCGAVPTQDAQAFDQYLARHAAWFCPVHNKMHGTHTATENADGYFRLKYYACKLCGPSATPAWRPPDARIFGNRGTPGTPIARTSSLVPVPPQGSTAPEPVPRLVGILGDLSQPLDDATRADWERTLEDPPMIDQLGVKLMPEDLQTLRTKAWVSNFVISLFARIANRTPGAAVMVWHTDMYRKLSIPLYNFAEVRSWISRSRHEFETHKVFCLPALVNTNHYVLGVVDTEKRTIKCFDSLVSCRWDRLGFVKDLRRWYADSLEELGMADEVRMRKPWRLITRPPGVPQQRDHNACGVFVCAFIAALSAGTSQFPFSHSDVPELRLRIGLTMARDVDAPETAVDNVARDDDVVIVDQPQRTLPPLPPLPYKALPLVHKVLREPAHDDPLHHSGQTVVVVPTARCATGPEVSSSSSCPSARVPATVSSPKISFPKPLSSPVPAPAPAPAPAHSPATKPTRANPLARPSRAYFPRRMFSQHPYPSGSRPKVCRAAAKESQPSEAFQSTPGVVLPSRPAAECSHN